MNFRFPGSKGRDVQTGDEEVSVPEQVVEDLVQRLLTFGIDGVGPLDSAATVAAGAKCETSSDQAAMDKIVADHVRLAAAEGFLTGLGGFVTMPVALPVNIVAFYTLAARMVAAIAAVKGMDPTAEETRTAVLLVLSGDDAQEILRKAGKWSGTGRLASLALKGLPPPVLMAVNKGVAFRLLVQVGEKGLASFGRAIPGFGGVFGGGLDAWLIRGIGKRAPKDLDRLQKA